MWLRCEAGYDMQSPFMVKPQRKPQSVFETISPTVIQYSVTVVAALITLRAHTLGGVRCSDWGQIARWSHLYPPTLIRSPSDVPMLFHLLTWFKPQYFRDQEIYLWYAIEVESE